MGFGISLEKRRSGRGAVVFAAVAFGAVLGAGACGSPGNTEDVVADGSPPAADSAPAVPTMEAGADVLADTGNDAGSDVDISDGDATTTKVDATDDAGGDATVDTGLPDVPPDASPEGSTDAPVDSSPEATPDSAPSVCGDGVRDPAKEECDNGAGNSNGTGACSTTCQVQDFLASSTVSAVDAGALQPFEYPAHTLGQGRHPVAAGPGGFAVTFLEAENNGDFRVRAEAFDPGGVRVASFPVIGTPGPDISNADPVVAPLASTQYVALWGDTGVGQVGAGVAMAILDTTTGTVGPVIYANAGAGSPETAPDALWLGSSLVVAWVDGSGSSSDLKYATFDAALNRTGAESYLANTSAAEADVTLAAFNGSWAAAWRAAENGLETVHVKAGSTEVVTNAFWGGSDGERPALVQVGPTTLFVAFSVSVGLDDAGDVTTTVLEGAVVDMAAGAASTVTASDVALDAQADGGDSRFPEGAPALVTAGGQVWLAAWTGGQLGDPLEDEVWLAPMANGAPGTAGGAVMPLPRGLVDRGGDQRGPALAVSAAGVNGALVGAWVDYGADVGGEEARPDVVVEVVPVPVTR